MAKRLLLPIVAFGIFFCLSSCTDGEQPGTTFPDYAAFAINRSAWTEPGDYSFTYEVRWGDGYVYAPVSVTVSGGTAEIDYGENDDPGEFTDNPLLGDISFESIAGIYEYFENWWEKTAAEENTGYVITFSVQYNTTSGGTVYPVYLEEDMHPLSVGADGGYGGLYIHISNLIIPE
ncbi:MAG TPA: hypothetical protein DCL73_15555 [Treponema sp.]|nr:hypothetical protein [Treponema sp.]